MWPHLNILPLIYQKIQILLLVIIELVSTNHVALLITVVLQLNNSASNSVCLSQFHVATCATLNLVCLHRATLPGNTPCYVTNDELELTVKQNKAVYQKHQPIFGQCNNSIIEQKIEQMPSVTQHQAMNEEI